VRIPSVVDVSSGHRMARHSVEAPTRKTLVYLRLREGRGWPGNETRRMRFTSYLRSQWNLKVDSGILTPKRFGSKTEPRQGFLSAPAQNCQIAFATGLAGKDQEYGRFIFFRIFLLED
jgi:hypothetical protein